MPDLQGRRFRHVKIQLVRELLTTGLILRPLSTLVTIRGAPSVKVSATFRGEPELGVSRGGWGSRGPLMRSAPQSAVWLYRWHSVFYLVFRPFCSLTKSNVPQLVSSLWRLYTPPVYAWLLLTCFGKQHPWKNLWWQKWMISLCLGKKVFLKNRLGTCGMQPEL